MNRRELFKRTISIAAIAATLKFSEPVQSVLSMNDSGGLYWKPEVTQKFVNAFIESFETSRVLSKTTNTQLLSGKFKMNDSISIKRPKEYRTFVM